MRWEKGKIPEKFETFWYFTHAVLSSFLTHLHCTGDPVSDSACSFLNELFWTLPWKLPFILGVKIGTNCAFLNLLWAIVVFQKLYQLLIVRAVFISFQICAKNAITIQHHGENFASTNFSTTVQFVDTISTKCIVLPVCHNDNIKKIVFWGLSPASWS